MFNPNTNLDDYRTFLKNYRKKTLHYTKKYVCHNAGISYNTLTGIENGYTKSPKLEVLFTLASFYNLSLADVFAYTQNVDSSI